MYKNKYMGYLKDIEAKVNMYEEASKMKLMSGLPIICRLDGSSFSTFTKGLVSPYDIRLTNLMIECCKYLVEYTNAKIGFVGSDEISLIIYEPDLNTQPIYNGRIEKILSELPAKLSVRFNKLLPKYLPEKVDKEPYFDCKVWNVPTIEDAINCLWMREESVFKNAITMASLNYYSHKELECKNGSEKQEMLFQKGINFNDYPVEFKRGVYIKRIKKFRKYTTEEIDKLPLKHKARENPDLEVERTEIVQLNIPPLKKIKNKVGVLFYNEEVKGFELNGI